ncbi:hypothetical protein MasN3_26440 [Massilia varians]|uniref:Uncharacterized protein n=1 Tax=Massilia varians TaxID=457921 RepID=A0ABM8C7F8_9BURK|nr:hypothetical protein MasN3_26440 [Massilia varians]
MRATERLRFATASIAAFWHVGAHLRAIILMGPGIYLHDLQFSLQVVACDSRGCVPMVPDQQTQQTPGYLSEGGSHAKNCSICFDVPLSDTEWQAFFAEKT